ncbi:hypothetical protein ASE11_16415 [Hydrogenophaga sp. Root209]|nr:hypothetical protein ASE11_16415 [Hydrogenophaga sp. Root209]
MQSESKCCHFGIPPAKNFLCQRQEFAFFQPRMSCILIYEFLNSCFIDFDNVSFRELHQLGL